MGRGAIAKKEKAYRNARGFNPAMCCTFRVSWPWRRCRRLNVVSSTGTSAVNEPSGCPVNGSDELRIHTTPENLPHISFACGATMSSPFIRRAIVTEERYSDWLWNSVWHSRFCPLFDSGPASGDANEGRAQRGSNTTCTYYVGRTRTSELPLPRRK
jgi:hypothetical protein